MVNWFDTCVLFAPSTYISWIVKFFFCTLFIKRYHVFKYEENVMILFVNENHSVFDYI